MTAPVRAHFIMERSDGHRSHAANLEGFLGAHPRPGLRPSFSAVPRLGSFSHGVPFAKDDLVLRTAWDGRSELSRVASEVDIAFVHTLLAASFSARVMRRVPTMVSLDATPRQWWELAHRFHEDAAPRLSRRLRTAVTHRLHVRDELARRAMARAVRVVTWSEWAKRAICQEYGVPASDVSIVPPGIDTERFAPLEEGRREGERPVRLLFVGGNFARKGGDMLLRWARHANTKTPWELHIMTYDRVEENSSNIIVHRGIANNDPAFVALYQASDVFVLPTHADTRPIVIMEALSSGLPVVASPVGAIPEMIVHGKTGFLVGADDFAGFDAALTCCVDDENLRMQMSTAARRSALEHFNAEATYGELADLVARTARSPRGTG